jgi:hypothetical protein
MSEAFINSPLALKTCAKCKGWIYECHVEGWRTCLEPNPLNFDEEVAMRLAGRSIFQTIGIDQPTLVKRSLWHIQKDWAKVKVLASHSCHTPALFEPAPLFDPPIRPTSEGIPF